MLRLVDREDDSIFSDRHRVAKAYLKELELELEKTRLENADWEAEYEALRAENLTTKASLLGASGADGRPPIAPIANPALQEKQLVECSSATATGGRRGSPRRTDTGAKLATLDLLRQHMIDQGSFVEKDAPKCNTDSSPAQNLESPKNTTVAAEEQTSHTTADAASQSGNEGGRDERVTSNSSLSQDPPSARDETRQGTEYSDGTCASSPRGERDLDQTQTGQPSSPIAPGAVDAEEQAVADAMEMIQCAVLRQYAFQWVPQAQSS